MDQELVRAYTRIGILVFFSAMFCFVIIKHTGLEEGAIAPMTIYSFISGLLAGKLIDFYMGDKNPGALPPSPDLLKELDLAKKKIAELENIAD